MEEKKIDRPLILEVDEAKKEIVQAINSAVQTHNVPFYVLDMILSDVCRQVGDAAKAELAQARAYVEQQQAPECE